MKNDDVTLIRRILAGDETAFTELVKKHQKPVHMLAWRKIGDFHIAEDITQDVFLKVYQRLHTLKNPNQFSGWLYVITTNLCATWLRKNRIQTQPLEDVGTTMEQRDVYSRHVTADRAKTAAEAQREVVKRLLTKLKESERTVMTLHYLGEMTVEEISRFLGVSAGTIKSRLQRARQRLQKEETMIREALDYFQISPNLTNNIMQEVARLKPAAPSGGKPLVPWIVAASSAVLIMLMLGISSQYLVRFQKPYILDAQAEMAVELVDAPIVQGLNVKPDVRTQLGSPDAPGKNNGAGQQVYDATSLDLDTIIAKIKHYDNAVTSVTGDFIIERHRNYEISGNPIPPGNLSIERNIEPKVEKNEYNLTFEGEKVRVEPKERRYTNLPVIQLWDGKQHWEVSSPGNLLFKVEIIPNKEITVLEKIQQAFKKVGTEIADDVRIVKGELQNSYRVFEKDKSYFVLFVGEAMVEVYKHNVGYAVRPHWAIMPSEQDPRWWLTFPSDGSDNTYLSQSLWQLLEKHESEIIGSEVLDGEKTTVIRLTKPARFIGDRKIPPQHYKLWISHNKGFRLVKSEETFTSEDQREWSPFKFGVTYINTRKIEYHEYLPDVWFPKRIEKSIVPKVSSEKQNEESVLFKDVFITKQCQLNTDVSEELRLKLSPDTQVYDYSVSHLRTVGDLETQPNFQMPLDSSDVPKKKNVAMQQVSDTDASASQQWHLPEGAITRLGKGRINKIAYSPDGKRLAVASSIGVWIYDADSGKELDLLTENTNWVQSIAFNPNGNVLASGGDDGSIRLWDTRTSTHLRTMTDHTSLITNIVFSGDGKMLASASRDNIVRLWDMQTGKIRKTLHGHADKIFSLSLSSDGTTLASASQDNTIRLWDTQTGKIRKTHDLEHSNEIFKMTFSPDGKTLASWSFENPIRLWDVQTGEPLHTLTLQLMDIVNELAFSPDGKTIASAMNNGIVHLWNAQTGERRRILIGHTHWVLRVVFSPDGKTIASGSYDATVRLWDTQTGKLQKTLTGHLSEILSVAFSPDGKMLANVVEDDTICLWDAQTGALHRTLKDQRMSDIQCLALSSDGKTLASSGYDRAIHLWDVQTGEIRKTLTGHEDTVTDLAFSVDRTTMASASWDKNIQLYDVQTGEIRKTLTGHTDWVMSVAFSPDGKTIASGSKDTTICLWDVQTGKLLKTFIGHADVVFSVAFNPDGKTIASGSRDGLIHLWDVQTGELLKTTEHTDWVMSVAFSPDGKTIASGSKDSTIQLWDTQTNIVQQIPVGHTSWVTSVAFSPDGRTLVSGSRDGTLLLWEITSDADQLK